MHVHEVTRRLSALSGFEITVLATDRSRRLPRQEVMEGIPVLRVPSWPRGRDYYFAPGIAAVIEQTASVGQRLCARAIVHRALAGGSLLDILGDRT